MLHSMRYVVQHKDDPLWQFHQSTLKSNHPSFSFFRSTDNFSQCATLSPGIESFNGKLARGTPAAGSIGRMTFAYDGAVAEGTFGKRGALQGRTRIFHREGEKLQVRV